jgi:hypothetical protein
MKTDELVAATLASGLLARLSQLELADKTTEDAKHTKLSPAQYAAELYFECLAAVDARAKRRPGE